MTTLTYTVYAEDILSYTMRSPMVFTEDEICHIEVSEDNATAVIYLLDGNFTFATVDKYIEMANSYWTDEGIVGQTSFARQPEAGQAVVH